MDNTENVENLENSDNLDNEVMNDDIPAEEEQEKKGKRRPIWLVILLVFIVILFLLSSVLLGSQLYKMATRDQHTVELNIGNPKTGLELFRIEYSNETGDITVKGVNAQKVVAPGTTVNYDIHLRNDDDVIIDFLLTPSVEFLTADKVPLEFKMTDANGNYVLGSKSTWVSADVVNELEHKGSVHPGEVYTYHFSWRWVFEKDAEQDAYDTYLANQNGKVLPGVKVSIMTESTANPMPVKSNTHMMHLFGESFGCCWCCYIVWILLLIILLLAIWIWRLRRKLNKYEDEYGELLEEKENIIEEQGVASNEQG